jgi:hypothetical protein
LRIAAEHVSHRHLVSFCRGLFLITTAAQQLAPAHDPLREAVEELRLRAVFAEFRELFTLRHLGDSADKYAVLMAEMPKRLDEALTVVSKGRVPLDLGAVGGVKLRQQRKAAAVAVLLLLASMALWLHFMIIPVTDVPRSTVVFVAVGALLLHTVSRIP